MSNGHQAGASAARALRRQVPVHSLAPYSVVIGPGVLRELPEQLASFGQAGVAVLMDTTVQTLYGDRLHNLNWATKPPCLALEPGEQAKSFAVLEGVLDFLVEQKLDRNSVLVTLGGGVIGDLGGLAASLYMRGIQVVHCPSTLLAMVDASVGGKTAVNLGAGKNLAGSFHQPALVLADTDLLASLPAVELTSGLGEVVKSALVGDPGLLDFLSERAEAVASKDSDALVEIVTRCVQVKAAVVSQDERESGQRKVLNLGHTFGHSIEWVAGFGTIPHGLAVAAGLGLATRAAESSGVLLDPDLPASLEQALRCLGLPAGLDDLRRDTGLDLPAEALMNGLNRDKKSRDGEPTFVLPRRAGEILVDCPLDRALLGQLLA